MSKPSPYPYYTIWDGSLNFGDTPGVFHRSTFVGLLLHFPITITFITPGQSIIPIMLETNEVEVFNGKKHPVFFNWQPGQPFPSPAGYIDDVDLIPGRPEFHLLQIDATALVPGKYSLTVVVNLETDAGLKDDFILYSIDMDENTGAKVGW